MKVCTVCGIEKDELAFSRNGHSPTSRRSKCKTCEAEYQQENAENYRRLKRNWEVKNKAKRLAIHARRRAEKSKATPKWADKDAIAEIYKQAVDMSEQDGIEYHVDHVVCLHNPKVCGLHWEGNLQILTAFDNLSKGNRWWPDMWEEEKVKIP